MYKPVQFEETRKKSVKYLNIRIKINKKVLINMGSQSNGFEDMEDYSFFETVIGNN